MRYIQNNMIYTQNKNFNFIKTGNKDLLKGIESSFVIALDFDGVITSPYKLKTEYINKLGYNIIEEECSNIYLLEKLGVKKEDYNKASIKAYTEIPKKLPLENDFYINFLRIRKLESSLIFILTRRFDFMMDHMEEYLRFHKIKVDGVINTHNQNKLKYLNLLNANFFVDDNPSNILEILNENLPKDCCIILYRNNQNKKTNILSNNRILEVNNWNSLADIIIKEHERIIKN